MLAEQITACKRMPQRSGNSKNVDDAPWWLLLTSHASIGSLSLFITALQQEGEAVWTYTCLADHTSSELLHEVSVTMLPLHPV